MLLSSLGDTGNDFVGMALRNGCRSVVQIEMMPGDELEKDPYMSCHIRFICRSSNCLHKPERIYDCFLQRSASLCINCHSREN